MKLHLKKLFVLLAIICFLPVTHAQGADNSLGIGLTVIPLNDGTKANLSFNNQLWFGVKQGKSFTRQFQVSSASAIAQRVEFELFDVLYENGSRSIRTDKKSVTSPWVQFSPPEVVIPPRGIAQVSMTYRIPEELKDSSYESFLRVNAFAANLPKQVPTKDGGVRVVLAGSAAIDTPVWLGVGDPKNLISDFEIKKVFGVLIDGEKKLRVQIKNTGKTPLGLDGTVQLTDSAFSDRTFGPFGYRSSEIQPGKEVGIDIVMPEDVTEGKWNIYVVAEQGNIRKTKVFEEDLTFKPLGSEFPIQILLGLLGLVGLLVGVRLIRSKPDSDTNKGMKVNKTELLRKQLETEKLIAELEAKAEAAERKAASLKKSAAKKSATAKKSTKKSTKKKTPAKVATTPAKPLKKTTTRKATPKKSPTKKVVKKRR